MIASLSFEGLSDLRGPYEGTDWLGHAFHVVRLGDAGRLPVCLAWSSSPAAHSKWFGRGWTLPLLESRIFPIGEKSLELHLPDGYVRYFHRDRDGRYVGGRFWTAERSHDKIRVTADSKDGFPRSVFAFSRGHLARMECAEGSYEFRSDPQGESIVSRGRPVFSIRSQTGDPNELRLDVGGTRLIAYKRPARLARAPGASGSSPTLVEEPCLAELVFADGSRKTFVYGVDGETARFAAGDSTWLWDTATRAIVAHDGARFAVGKRLNEMSGPKIRRTSPNGDCASVACDRKTGVTEETLADGRTVFTRRFTSGDNTGRVRSREYSAGGMMLKRVDYIYDANGCIREELVRGEDD